MNTELADAPSHPDSAVSECGRNVRAFEKPALIRVTTSTPESPVAARYLGQSVIRKEDQRHLTGHGLYVDYLLSTTSEVPGIETESTTNPGGYKGMGEGGAVGAHAAVAKAG